MVDAQALVLLEGAGLIVPEGITVRLVVAGAEGAGQPKIEERLEMGAGLGSEQGVVHPGAGIVYVLRRRDHVEVAGDDHRLLVGEERLDVVLEPRHPCQLVDELLGPVRIAVRQVDIDETERARRDRDYRFEIARLHIVGVACEPRADLVEGEFGKQRHAVEALLPVHGDVVAEVLEDLGREGLVGAFDLLQTSDIGRGRSEPSLGGVDARLDAVDVPGGDLHGVLLSLPGLTGQSSNRRRARSTEQSGYWIPAFAGMTREWRKLD